jgi:hypothetical protein
MKVDGTLKSQESSAGISSTPYSKNSNWISAMNAAAEVPEGHLYELRTNSDGAPAEPERRLIWFFCSA